jgi:carotenoid cleavage dioxygenase-like enzyme
MAPATPEADHRLGFETCAEVREPVALTVEGHLPPWLRGTLFRNGPGVWDIETKDGGVHSLDHWFDGLAVLHRFTVESGEVRYRNAHLARGLQRRIEERGHADHPSFGNDPCQGLFGKLFTLFKKDVTDPETGRSVQNTGVTIGTLPDGRLVSKTDANLLQTVDPETLEASEPWQYGELDGRVRGELAAAHSQRDRGRNRLVNFALKLGWPGRYTVFSLGAAPAEHRILARFPAPPAYIHSFALTERYVVLMVWPTHLNLLKLLWRRNITGSMGWKPEEGTVFHVVDRERGARVARYRSDAFFAFHNVNAWDDGDDIVLDLCAFDDPSVIDALFVDRLREGSPELARLRRYRLEGVSSAGVEEPRRTEGRVLSDAPIDLPRFDGRRHMRAYRYVYGISRTEGAPFWDALVKVDVETGAHRSWSEEGCYPGEPVFVAAPGRNGEDEGVVLSVVLDGRDGSSFLLVLDAGGFREVARATGAPTIPFGFHGNFYGAGPQEP